MGLKSKEAPPPKKTRISLTESLEKKAETLPNLPFLAFWDFLAFLGLSKKPFSPSFPGILGVQKRRKILVFLVVFLAFSRKRTRKVGRTPQGTYSSRGRSRHLLETAFSEPLLRTLLRTLFYCKTHSRPPSQNPSEKPFPRTLPRTFSEPFLERCVAVRPHRRAPKKGRSGPLHNEENCKKREKQGNPKGKERRGIAQSK